ncbi:DUF885 domain-containing protein [Microbacterium lacticum]|uniref:DUF885 domain-containing protein n=1 Tax=Microbacterium lacticum TaxID=33885 RepID=UPI0018B04A8E|nr:DUF885 domain-containing protein [Microbacterium lacticum]MBF9336468.1 DUF885 domain-containing protein [Microbacterium lacticum]
MIESSSAASSSASTAPVGEVRTAVDRFSDMFICQLAAADPYFALDIGLGLELDEPRFRDYSPAGEDDFTNWMSGLKVELQLIQSDDAYDEFTRAEILATIERQQVLHDRGLHLKDLNVIDSPLQRIYESLSFMPSRSDVDRERAFALLRRVPEALAGYRASLEEGVRSGRLVGRRQVVAAAKQCKELSNPAGFFRDFATSMRHPDRGMDETAVARAEAAYGEFDTFLRTELAPKSADIESCGRDEHALHIDHFVGARVDVDDSYSWALDELSRVSDEMVRAARVIRPGGTLAEVFATLRADSEQRLSRVEDVREWVSHVAETVAKGLRGREFGEQLRHDTLEVVLAPVSGTGIYYLPPQAEEDLGKLVWSAGEDGLLDVAKWRDLTTVVHEGIPGHHVQMVQGTLPGRHRNLWRSKVPGGSGYVEGWALYAESIVEGVGLFSDPAYRLGYLNSQRLRLARVVLDIGIHSRIDHPDGGAWSRARAEVFLRENVVMSDALQAYEIDRYFGWPGQASSYKLGERFWWDTRTAFLRARDDASPIAFHEHVLSLGGGRLDNVRRALDLESSNDAKFAG